MGTAQKHEPMDVDDLRDADTQILEELGKGRATKGMLVDSTEFSRNTVYNRLEVLEAAGHIGVVHEGTRLFELVDDPRNESASQAAGDGPATEDLQARIEDLESDLTQAREEINALRDERDTLTERLEETIHPEDVHAVVLELRGALERGDRADIDAALSRLGTIAGVVG